MTHTTEDMLTMKDRLEVLERAFNESVATIPATPLRRFTPIDVAEDPAGGIEAFAQLMAAGGPATKERYLALRDLIRAALREAEALQRARRKAEVALRGKLDMDRVRERIYMHLLWKRRTITALIAMRRAGKLWSQAEAAKVRAEAA